DCMPTSRPECGGSRTPTGKKENGQDDEGNERHDPDDHALHACGPLIGPGFLWSPVCHKALLVHETTASWSSQHALPCVVLLQGPHQEGHWDRIKTSFIPRTRV